MMHYLLLYMFSKRAKRIGERNLADIWRRYFSSCSEDFLRINLKLRGSQSVTVFRCTQEFCVELEKRNRFVAKSNTTPKIDHISKFELNCISLPWRPITKVYPQRTVPLCLPPRARLPHARRVAQLNVCEYAKVPLENCTVLNEKRLLGSIEEGGLGYQLESLLYMMTLLVPYGGLRDIHLQAGETIIVSPATGSFSGAAVRVALAMGARVIAMGRNVETLRRVAALSERVEAVPFTGDAQIDLEALQYFSPIDAYFEINPPTAATSNNIKTAIQALRPEGRVSLMGGISEDVPLPLSTILYNNLTLKGTYMYKREDVAALIKMVELGLLKLDESVGVKVVGKFGLEDRVG